MYALKLLLLALPVNNKKDIKFGYQTQKGTVQRSKFLAKPTGKTVSGGKNQFKLVV